MLDKIIQIKRISAPEFFLIHRSKWLSCQYLNIPEDPDSYNPSSFFPAVFKFQDKHLF